MANKSKKRQNNVNGAEGNNGTNGTNGPNEPLRIFDEAKEKINRLFDRINDCVGNVSSFYSAENLDPEIIKNVDTAGLKQLVVSVGEIKNVLSRNHMKVAFFGKTSNGKSTAVNAILHDKVVPAGMGTTTTCFLQIQGSRSNEAFLETSVSEKTSEGTEVVKGIRHPIQDLERMATAAEPGSKECSKLVKIHLPISRYPLLNHNVVIVDSPGANVVDDLDGWIDKHCRDADVFVLTSRADACIEKSDLNFFQRVRQRLSKPNIFILHNYWDFVEDNDEATPDSVQELRNKLMQASIKFLTEGSGVSSDDEARRRTFFVSAKEALRLRSSGESPEGAKKSRYEEFEKFEHRFEEALSKSAVRTKFTEHTEKGKRIIEELANILNNTESLVLQVRNMKDLELRQVEDRMAMTERTFCQNEDVLRKEVATIATRIATRIEAVFNDELTKLPTIVRNFDLEFSTNADKLNLYKQELYHHVEKSLSQNLEHKINLVIKRHVNPFNESMRVLSKLLAQTRRETIEQYISTQSYDDSIDLKPYRKFLADFKEDLEFRFSFVSIIRKILDKLSLGSKPIQSGSPTDQASNDVLSMVERFLLFNPQSQTAVGSMVALGVTVRTVGFKVLIVTSTVVGSLYLYEYLTWTTSAKERAFKAQYVKHVKNRLQNCDSAISGNIAKPIGQVMTKTYSRVKDQFDAEVSELKKRQSLLRASLASLVDCERNASTLLGESNFLFRELEAFATSFLFA